MSILLNAILMGMGRSGTGGGGGSLPSLPSSSALFWYEGDGSGGTKPPAFSISGSISEGQTITLTALSGGFGDDGPVMAYRLPESSMVDGSTLKL